MTDTTLVFIIVFLLLLAHILRIVVSRKTKSPLTTFDLVQGLLFPIALLLTEGLYRKTGKDYLLIVLLVGIVEELYFSHKRRKRQKNAKD